jgi:hypothetical protein
MARQVIFVSQTIFSMLSGYTAIRDGKDGVLFRVQVLHDSETSLGVKTALRDMGYGTPAPMMADDLVLVISREPNPDPRFRPLPLPDDIVHVILDHFGCAVFATVGDLSGHDALEFAEAVDAARSGAVIWPTLHREPANGYEADLVRAATDVEAIFLRQLTQLDARHVALRDAAIRHQLVEPIRSLSLSGLLADALHVGIGVGRESPYALSEGHVRAAMEGLNQAEADGDIYTQSMMRHMRRHDRTGIELWPFRLIELFDAALSREAEHSRRQLWRNHACSQRFGIRLPVAAADIEKALLRLAAAFDAALLGDVHPVIRAALAMYELLRIEPGVGENERVAGYVFASMLDAGGYFALPLPLMLHRRRDHIIDAFGATCRLDRPHTFIAEIVFLYERAIEVGERMISQLLPWRDQIVAYLARDRVPADQVGKLADGLASEPLIERVRLSSIDGDNWRDLGPSLHAGGFLERLEIGGETWWSPILPRKLAASWTIWPTRD